MLQIWASLEAGRHCAAACAFLRAVTVNAALGAEDADAQALLKAFPVRTTQWAAIAHFRDVRGKEREGGGGGITSHVKYIRARSISIPTPPHPPPPHHHHSWVVVVAGHC